MSSTPSPEVHSVTTARKSLAQDQDERARRYFISMGIRTVCFIVGVFTPQPWCWFFFVGAVLLPYVAVVLANAVNVHEEGEVESVDAQALTPSAAPLVLTDGTVLHPDVDPEAAPAADDPHVHPGEVLHVRDHGPVGPGEPDDVRR